jgi:hypothetical protein
MTHLKDPNLKQSNSQFIHIDNKTQPHTVARETPTLETQSNELQKLNAELHAKYQTAQDTISELQGEKSAYAKQNRTLEGAIADAYSAIDGFVGSHTPVLTYEQFCSKSWNRNQIVDARVPIRNADTDGEANVNDVTDKIVLDKKHTARELELRCDCGITFNVTGDNLKSIKTKHCTGKSKKRRRRRAKRKATTSVEAKSDAVSTSPSACQQASAGLRCGRQRDDIPNGSEDVSCLAFVVLALVFSYLVFCYHMDAL